MTTLIAKTALRYASTEIAAGERFEASESDASILVRVGKADRVEDVAGDLSSADTSSQAHRRRYNRRDMRPQD